MSNFSHVTIMTGDVTIHRPDTLAAGMDACRPLLPDGGPVPEFPAFRVEITGPMFTVWRGRDPVVTCAVGRDDNALWGQLTDLQKRFGPVKAEQPKGQWLAVVILPGMGAMTMDDIGWLGDFERCLGAVLLEEVESMSDEQWKATLAELADHHGSNVKAFTSLGIPKSTWQDWKNGQGPVAHVRRLVAENLRLQKDILRISETLSDLTK